MYWVGTIATAAEVQCNTRGLSVQARVCVCLLLQDLVQSCLHGGGGGRRTCTTRDDEPRPVWTKLPITH
jgi:hypothetical protein